MGKMTKVSARRYLMRSRVSLALFFLAAIATAFIAWRIDPSSWSVTDTANLLISLILGLYFFRLAQYVNRKAEARADAVANADLITSTGVLAMNSARSLSGSESAALRVAADARAALQHYLSAEAEIQKALRASVISAYNDLAFSIFLRSDSLPRSVWARLCEGTAHVVAEADKLAFSRTGQVEDKDLVDVSDHVGFVELLGRALRENARLEVTAGERILLPEVWDTSKLPSSRRLREARPAPVEILHRLDRFEMLYQDELTVLHDWSVLRANAARLHCEVELVDIAATNEWLAPWFIKQGMNGGAKPVNVLGRDLEERARYDQVRTKFSTPRWPNALRHGALPEGMRAKSIQNLCRVLESQPSPTICVFAYELCVNEQTGETKRVVLDGNHRLAAARRLSIPRTLKWKIYRPSRRFKVLTFLIQERQPVDNLVQAGGEQNRPYSWRGFTPDIGLLRGTWLPDR
jgi:hypothetical protein